MAVLLSPVGGVAGQFFDNNGNPLTGGKLYSYAAGTTTPQTTYTSSSGVTAHSNPIILDAGGRVPGGEIWLTDGLQYKFVLKNANDVLIGTYDNLVGINSNFVNFLTETEVQTATAGQTVFTLTTMQYQPGTNNLSVFVDGVNQIDGATYSYVETSSTVVTFTAGLHVGALVKFTTAQTLSTGVTDASLVTYDPPFTASVATTVEDKLAQYVSIKDFGAVGDNVTDDTAAIQLAYNYIATQGGGTVIWPSATYKVNGTICFSTNTSTDLCKSRIYANNQILFDCGYLSAGVVVSNHTTLNTDYSTALQNAVIGNGTIYGASLAFRLFKFLSGSRIHDIMCWDVGQIINARSCFYSDYSNIIRYETVDGSPKIGTATTRLGDSAIDVPNAMAANLVAGMTIGAGFVPYGTTITLVGAANSAGAGFAFVFLSTAATYAVASGAANSGFAASANLTPLYKFVGECSNLTFTKCSSASRFIGWELSDVNSSTFVAWDITACAYGFQFKQSCGGNDFTSGYTEGVYQWIFDFTQNIGAGGTVISVANYFQTAGAITAGPTGYVSGSITIPADIVGFTPYGYGPGGGPLVNLESPNAKITVIGGNADSKIQNPTSKSVFLTQGGLSLPNVVSSNPNTLDWYEENTFTPVLEGSTSAGVGAYTAQLGKFTRIGNRVFFTINLAWTSHTGTGNMIVSGFPYTPALVYRVFSLTGIDLAYTNGNQLAGQMGASSFTKMDVVQIAANSSPTAIAMDTAAQIFVTGNYEV